MDLGSIGMTWAASQAVLTMTQNIIQEQKDEARRIVEEQVTCYIGRLEAAVGTGWAEFGALPVHKSQSQACFDKHSKNKVLNPRCCLRRLPTNRSFSSALRLSFMAPGAQATSSPMIRITSPNTAPWSRCTRVSNRPSLRRQWKRRRKSLE